MSKPKPILPFSLILLSVFLLSHFPAWAAEAGNDWDARYKGDPAVILFYERVIEINKDLSFKKTIRETLKVQTEGGKSWGEIPIRYNRVGQVLIKKRG